MLINKRHGFPRHSQVVAFENGAESGSLKLL
jgi:hypothetical protein